MRDTGNQEPVNVQGISRRDFIKMFSLVIGGLSLPRVFTRTLERTLRAPKDAPNPTYLFFQWQNQSLCETIYPMREEKLRDFLKYYMEVDVWSQYKDKSIAALANDVSAYRKDWEINAAAAHKEYIRLRHYFLKEEVRADYSESQPLDEAELVEINNLHAAFAQSWPKNIRGERSFLERMLTDWDLHCQGIRTWIKWRRIRHEAMNPAHPKYIPEGEELNFKESITLPMAEREMGQLRAFLATYDKLEQRKLAWYQLYQNDPEFATPESDFITTFPPEQQVTLRDIARWKVETYTKRLAEQDQYELLGLIYQRFQKEPQRFPLWLQYMVVHFSGMRYASASGCWADPKDLLVRLRAPLIEAEIQGLDEAQVQALCAEKIAAYEATGGGVKPALAEASEKEWREQIGWYLPGCKANSVQARRWSLANLRKIEDAYEIMRKPAQEALQNLREIKNDFPTWAWKEVVRLTSLRVTEASDLDWERLAPQEQEAYFSQENFPLRAVLDAWKYADPSAWREEHARTQDLIVTRAVCNEVAEHCQHLRGRTPPGGLAPKPHWYAGMETDGSAPGAYFTRPTSEKDYTQGASIFWLRFVDYHPQEWQVARWIETRQKIGLLPNRLNPKSKKSKERAWRYDTSGKVVTRSRTILRPGKEKVAERQWLRWIHEATVAEVAETADGMVVLTFETALPDGAVSGTSSAGMLKMPLAWHLSDGTEDQYNRSFVGYVPEGQVPLERLEEMLDWKKVFSIARQREPR